MYKFQIVISGLRNAKNSSHLDAIRLDSSRRDLRFICRDRPRLTTAAGYIRIAIATRRMPRRRVDLLVERRYDKEL